MENILVFVLKGASADGCSEQRSSRQAWEIKMLYDGAAGAMSPVHTVVGHHDHCFLGFRLYGGFKGFRVSWCQGFVIVGF